MYTQLINENKVFESGPHTCGMALNNLSMAYLYQLMEQQMRFKDIGNVEAERLHLEKLDNCSN
jgi:hypothetical protein